MHKLLAVIVAIGVTVSACAPPSTPSGAPVPPSADVLPTLSVRDKIAQLIIPWIPGSYTAFDDDAFVKAERWIDSLHVGGIIVSVGSPLDIAAKLNRLQAKSRLPLLIASDLEGGTSIRLIGGTPFPPNMGVGATWSDSAAYEMGRITALEGRAVGIHLAFAPVADVNNNPANPIINTRAFSEDPRLVARLVVAEIRGLQEHGMFATAKHFPGHGDTGTDSHLALPVIVADWRRLDSVELVPFRAAVAAGVTSVMSAHIALPGLDSGRVRPGTIVPAVLGGLLRDSLGFNGLVVTDALNMGGIANEFGAEAAVRAFLAGADLLLQPADPAAAITAMENAVQRGDITIERLDRSVRRVLDLKQRAGLFERRQVPLDSIPLIVGRTEFQTRAREIAARSIVMVKDSGGLIHDFGRRRTPVTLVTYGEEDTRTVGNVLASELRSLGHTVTVFKLWPSSGPASFDSASALLERAQLALFATADRPVAYRGTLGLPAPLTAIIDSAARTRSTILVSLGNPYQIASLPSVGSYLIGWRSNPVTERAVAHALAGTAAISGRLPISIPPQYPIGWGLQRSVTP